MILPDKYMFTFSKYLIINKHVITISNKCLLKHFFSVKVLYYTFFSVRVLYYTFDQSCIKNDRFGGPISKQEKTQGKGIVPIEDFPCGHTQD